MNPRQQYMHDYYIKNKEKIVARSTARNKANYPDVLFRYRTRYKDRYRKSKMMKMYNLSSEEFDRLDVIRSCEICGRESQLTYDHDHNSGKVRGRICHSCNLGLGSLGDTIESLEKSLKYLKERTWLLG